MKHPVLTAEDREAHPGWAVKFSDGSWLCTTMMCDRVTDAFYATRYESAESALSNLDSARTEWSETELSAVVIEAWQPLVESLRVKVKSLNDVAKISPRDIDEITWSLEGALLLLKKAE